MDPSLGAWYHLPVVEEISFGIRQRGGALLRDIRYRLHTGLCFMFPPFVLVVHTPQYTFIVGTLESRRGLLLLYLTTAVSAFYLWLRQ